MTRQTQLLAGIAEAIASQGESPFLAFWRGLTEAAHQGGRKPPTYAEARDDWQRAQRALAVASVAGV